LDLGFHFSRFRANYHFAVRGLALPGKDTRRRDKNNLYANENGRAAKTRFSDSWQENGFKSMTAAKLPDATYIFKPEIPIWENFGGPWNEKGWRTLLPFGI
jgi:hypothetical protein